MPFKPKRLNLLGALAVFVMGIGLGVLLQNVQGVELVLSAALCVLLLLYAHQWNQARHMTALARRALARPITCEIVPRPDATPDQLKALGADLMQWCYREAEEGGLYRGIEGQALSDLLAGELPQPLFLRRVALAEGRFVAGQPGKRKLTPAEFQALKDRLGASAASRTLQLLVEGGAAQNRKKVIQSLRRDIPPDLVEDVLVDGQSWNEAE